MSNKLYSLASPPRTYQLAGKTIALFWWLTVIFCVLGLYWTFVLAPDRLGGSNPQKEYYRIIFIHVGAAWMSMWLYAMMVFWSAIGFIFKTRTSFMMVEAIAPTGAIFTFITLWTGAFWGRPSWGTYWDWDPRMTSELILLFLYFGYIALHAAIEDRNQADKASALLIIVGIVMVPLIFWSVNCPDPNQCAALHQQSKLGEINSTILTGMLLMTVGFWAYAFAATLTRLRNIILQREGQATWIRQLNTQSGDNKVSL